MRASTLAKLTSRLTLEPGEEVRWAHTMSVHATRRSAPGEGKTQAGKLLLSKSRGAEAESFVVLTDRRLAVVDRNPYTWQPTKTVKADIPLDVLTFEYRRGAIPSVLAWLPDGNGLSMMLGRLMLKSIDRLAELVDAQRVTN